MIKRFFSNFHFLTESDIYKYVLNTVKLDFIFYHLSHVVYSLDRNMTEQWSLHHFKERLLPFKALYDSYI